MFLRQLDRGARGDHRRGDDAGDRLGADRAADRAAEAAEPPAARAAERRAEPARRAARGSRAATRRGTAGRRAARGRTAAEAELGGDEALEGEQRRDREHRRQQLLVGADLGAEVGAFLALADVAAHRRGDLAQPLGRFGELDPDLAAGQQAGLARLAERDPRPHQQRLDRRHRRLHRVGDLLIGEGVHLAQEEGRALGLGKLVDVGDDLPELLAVMDLLRGRGGFDFGNHVHRFLRVGARFAEVVEAAVAGDPVEPGAEVDLPLVGEHRPVGVDEDLLQHVFGVLGRAEHLAAEAEQAALVAVDDHLEGARVARAGHRDQLLVALQFEQGRLAGEKPAATGVSKS